MVIIYSGGMDSTVMLNEYKDRVKLAVSFNYGSKHNEKELTYAKKNCEKLGIKQVVVDLPFINQLFKSNLLQSGGEIPDGTSEQNVLNQAIVPFRNGIMLSIAAGIAESVSAQKVLIACLSEDTYPDTLEVFIDSMNAASKLGTETEISIIAPYIKLTKREVALKGQQLGVDFFETWSCYKGTDKHCGICETCLDRKEALEGFDPTEYLN